MSTINKDELKFHFTTNTTNPCQTCLAIVATDTIGTEYVVAGGGGHLVKVSDLPKSWGFKRFLSKPECQRFVDNLPEEIELETPKTIRRFFGFGRLYKTVQEAF